MSKRRVLVLVAAAAAAALAVVVTVRLVPDARARDHAATGPRAAAGGPARAPRPPATLPARPVTSGLHGPRAPRPEVDTSAGVGDPAPAQVSDALNAALARVTARARTCFSDGAPDEPLAYTVTFVVRDHQARVTDLVLDDHPDGLPALDCMKGAVVEGATLPLSLPDGTIPVSSEWQPSDLVAVR